jgi:hypothetical protein
MAVKDLYQFTANDSQITYYVKYDIDANVVYAEQDPAGAPHDPAVSLSELGVNPLRVLYHTCVGTTYRTIHSYNLYPFARIKNVANSLACGYTGPDPLPLNCLFQGNPAITVTDETIKGQKDGSITINVTLFNLIDYLKILEYSLDGINWQASKTFSGLAPGNYHWFARSFRSQCKIDGYFTVNPGFENIILDYPWEDYYCPFFRLIRDGVVTYIWEPIKWDAVNIQGRRDKDWHGWKDQYSDELIELEFDCPAGKEVLAAEYALHGSKGKVQFEYGITYRDKEAIYFPGKIIFSTYKENDSVAKASVESKKYNPKTKLYEDTKVSMADTVSLQGIPILAPALVETRLHSKELSRLFKAIQDPPLIAVGFIMATTGTIIVSDERKLFISFDYGEPQANEIETTTPTLLGWSTDAPYDTSLHLMKIKYEGVYNFAFQQDFKLTYKCRERTGTIKARGYFMINDGPKIQVGPTVEGTMNNDGPWETSNISFVYQTTLTLYPDDEVYVWIEIEYDINSASVGNNMQLIIDQTRIYAVVSALEQASASDSKGLFIFEAIDHAIRTITDGESYLKSNFLSRKNGQQAQDGPGALTLCFNGKQIRQFDQANNPLKVSYKTLTESMRALFCLGRGMENIAGVDVVRIERFEFFYQDKEIFSIDHCWDYEEQATTDLLYNEYEVGFSKFKTEGANTLDEFNTKQEGITALTDNKLKLPIICEAITSGYTIEEIRRQQFSTTPTNAFSHDDDLICISALRAAGNVYTPERAEAFIKVENLISPNTAYNLRWSPARMLRNWFVLIRDLMHYSDPSERIVPKQHVQNGKLITQLRPDDVRFVGDILKAEIQEDKSFALEEVETPRRIMTPDYQTFKCKLTPDKAQLLNRCLKGGGPDEKNYGWIAVKYKGEYRAGYPLEMDYNFRSEVAVFKLRKKYGNPVIPAQPCCPWLSVDGCYILVNGVKVIV